MDIKLKPCPFCGGEAMLIHGTSYAEHYSSQVQCSKCGAKIKEIHRAVDYCADEKAAEAWNRRADEVKRGKWRKHDIAMWECSVCGTIQIADDKKELKYCCTCGAKMDEVE